MTLIGVEPRLSLVKECICGGVPFFTEIVKASCTLNKELKFCKDVQWFFQY